MKKIVFFIVMAVLGAFATPVMAASESVHLDEGDVYTCCVPSYIYSNKTVTGTQWTSSRPYDVVITSNTLYSATIRCDHGFTGAPCVIHFVFYYLETIGQFTYHRSGYYDFNVHVSPVTYELTVESADLSMGFASGSGTYTAGTQVGITASWYYGYSFSHWSDGNTSPNRTVTVNSDATYIAYFVPDVPIYTISVTSNNSSMGTVSGGGNYADGQTAVLRATAKTGYRFLRWNDGNTANPRSVVVHSNASYTAYFASDVPIYTISVTSDNNTMGTVSGGGNYADGQTAVLRATANTGYRFLRWNDGNTDNPRSVVVHSNASYTAYFAPNSQVSISEDDVDSGFHVWSTKDQIVISNAVGKRVWIYDMMGRLVNTVTVSDYIAEFCVLDAGVYLVQIEGNPAQKVLVTR